MITDFSKIRSEPREMSADEIDLVSTSTKTADASVIILNRTDIVQTKFEPVVIDNNNAPERCVSGKLIYEKKRVKDIEFPTEKLTRQSIKVGDHMEIRLDTSETYALFCGLQRLYELKGDIGYTPIGSATYTKVDDNFKQFFAIIQKDPSAARLLITEDNIELVKLLLKLITQTDSTESLNNSLKALEGSNISILNNAINIEKLRRVLELIEKNLDNDNEEKWHRIFKENQWILSQIFSCSYTIFDQKAYVGGKGLSNKGGRLCDFIYNNNITKNLALIEIKTPCTPLVGSAYRSTFSLSDELSGAINQVLDYKDFLTKEYFSLSHNSDSKFELFNPKCFVIAGKANELAGNQISMLENFRNSLANVEVITYDELAFKISDMLSLFNEEETYTDCIPNDLNDDTLSDGELPF